MLFIWQLWHKDQKLSWSYFSECIRKKSIPRPVTERKCNLGRASTLVSFSFLAKRRWPVCPWALHAYARSIGRIRKESSACCFAQECHLRFASRFISTHWRRQDEADFWLLALFLFYFLAMPKLLSIARFGWKQSALFLFKVLEGNVQPKTLWLMWSMLKTRYNISVIEQNKKDNSPMKTSQVSSTTLDARQESNSKINHDRTWLKLFQRK